MTIPRSSDKEEVEDALHLETMQDSRGGGFREAMRELLDHRKICAIAAFLNAGSFIYGYDNYALSMCLSLPPFQRQFGKLVELGAGSTYIIPAHWQSLWNALAQLATALGAFLIASISDRFGRRFALLASGAVCAAGIAVLYTCEQPGTFLAGKMINAFGLGMSLSVGQTYIAEVSPLKIRGILLSMQYPLLTLGALIAAILGYYRLGITSSDSYKTLIAVGWSIPGLLALCAYAIPESPIFYIHRDELDKARSSLNRLHRKGADVGALLEEAVKTDREERELTNLSSNSTYSECFRGKNWRRMRIILYLNGLNQLLGSTFVASSAYFLVSAGLHPHDSLKVLLIGAGISFFFSLVVLGFVGKLRRRIILLGGIAICVIFFLPMGIAGCWPGNKAALWAIGVLQQIVSIFGAGPTYGPALGIAAEIPQLRLKSKAVSIGFLFNYIFSAAWNTAVPYMFTQDQGNLGGKVGFIFAATSILSFIIIWFEVPETKDISYTDLDYLFNNDTPARKFKAEAQKLRTQRAGTQSHI